jgi:hypothetical protein
MFFEPRSKGLKAIQRRVGGSKAIANISASFETLEPRHYCDANDDVFTKTAADFAQSADPNKNLVTSLDILANDTARSKNKADLSIGLITYIGPTFGATLGKPTQTLYMPDGGYLKLTGSGDRNTGIQYGLPTRVLLSLEDYDLKEKSVRNEIETWCDRERDSINNYYSKVDLTLLRIGDFVRSNIGGGSGGFGSGGSSLKDILGLRSVGISPGPGVVLSIGGRAIDFLLASYAKNQLATLEDAIHGAFQEASNAHQAELDKFDIEQKRLLDDFELNLSKVGKRVFGNFSFVYSEVDGSPVTSPPPPPRQLGGMIVSPAAASVKTSSSATVAVNMNIEDYSAKLAQLNAWCGSHGLTSHRYDQELKERTLDDMYGDALIAFSNRAGFDVTWENGAWVGRDLYSGMEPYMWQGDGAFGTGVVLYRSYTFDGLDIADELNKIKYKKR